MGSSVRKESARTATALAIGLAAVWSAAASIVARACAVRAEDQRTTTQRMTRKTGMQLLRRCRTDSFAPTWPVAENSDWIERAVGRHRRTDEPATYRPWSALGVKVRGSLSLLAWCGPLVDSQSQFASSDLEYCPADR